MLENKKLNMIISLLIAISLWAFVIGEVNPEASRSYRDIPIRFVNQETLEQSDLAVYTVSQRTVNVTLRGNRSEINKIDNKDIVATVDLDDAAMGDNPLRVDVKVPSKVEIESQSVNKVIVTVERRVSKEVPVSVSYEGTFNGEEEPITVDVNPGEVTVYGAETTVGKVTAASALVAENSITEETQEITCSLIAVNEAGQKVHGVRLSEDSVKITSELAKLQIVPLHVPVEGEKSDGIERTVTVPETITIKGKAADLESITSITTEPVYLEDVLTNTTIPLVPILPEGVAVSEESEKLEAVIQVNKTETEVLDFDQAAVELRGLGEGLTAQAAEISIEVQLTGSENLLADLTNDDISLFADLSGLQAGRHRVKVHAMCAAGNPVISVNPKKITVIIREEADDSDSEEPENKEENNDQDINDDSDDSQDENDDKKEE